MSEFIKIEEVQERLSLSRDTVDRMIKRGDIEAVKIGKCVRISVESIDLYLREHTINLAKEFGGVAFSKTPGA